MLDSVYLLDSMLILKGILGTKQKAIIQLYKHSTGSHREDCNSFSFPRGQMGLSLICYPCADVYHESDSAKLSET